MLVYRSSGTVPPATAAERGCSSSRSLLSLTVVPQAQPVLWQKVRADDAFATSSRKFTLFVMIELIVLLSCRRLYYALVAACFEEPIDKLVAHSALEPACSGER